MDHRAELKHGLVVSDLHLFARRSEGELLLRSVAPQVHASKVIIFNGDTFDFRWSERGSERESVDAALEWLEKFIDSVPDKDVHFLLGNHDCLAVFVEKLKKWEATVGRFFSHEYHLKIGRCLFLHGDVANRRMGVDDLRKFRKQWASDRPRKPWQRRVYQATDLLKLSSAFHKLYFPPQRAVERVVFHLNEAFPKWQSEFDDIYFGHTHLGFEGYAHSGVRFHNTGSGIKGMGFSPLKFATKNQAL